PFDIGKITAVVLTHAHVDHCGLLPKLTRLGYKGPIVATPETADLLTYVLPDSGYIQEVEVEHLNRRNRQRGRDTVDPIYTREDAESCLQHVIPRGYDTWHDVAPGFRLRFWDAGHILGSASVELEVNEKGQGEQMQRLLFSGDIGPGGKAFQIEPQAPQGVDYIFAESTYGDRIRIKRSPAQRRAVLRNELRAALKAGGMILMPAFAIERTQELLVDIDTLIDTGELPSLPVFVDSPLATKATAVFAKHLDGKTGIEMARDGTHPFKRANLRFVDTVDESKRLNRLRGGAIILAGSGMCDAGRIRHHLKNNLGRSDTTVLLAGYQAPGSMGRILVSGARMVRIQGEEVAVNARIRVLDDYSGHADQAGLKHWIAARLPVTHNIFLIHGEDAARHCLAEELKALDLPRGAIRLPALGETVRLAVTGAKTERIAARVDVAAAGKADWHNVYADTVLQLRRDLEHLKDDRARVALLKKVRGTLARR
ncbi:MAG: MBL fold metallo-hydrolase, partial [Rhodospirillaceae bacterium]|nr:MBL fold metallo-hydrolase [Rhodospirillaceae bacterium]